MSSGTWKTVDTREFLAATAAREAYRFRGHVFTKRIAKRSPWPLACKGCGLLFLKNALTARAIVLGCYYDEHPSWRTR